MKEEEVKKRKKRRKAQTMAEEVRPHSIPIPSSPVGSPAAVGRCR